MRSKLGMKLEIGYIFKKNFTLQEYHIAILIYRSKFLKQRGTNSSFVIQFTPPCPPKCVNHVNPY